MKRILVAGASGFLGVRLVRALLEEGAEVTALIPPDAEEKLGSLRGNVHVNVIVGDVWNPGSLRGRARGHNVVVHLIGGLTPDPARGLTFRHLNTVSSRNTARMTVDDGVPHYLLMSAAIRPFGVAAEYLDSKREAESYLRKTGLAWTIVRMPPLYVAGQPATGLYRVLAFLRRLPLIGFLLANRAPMSVDLAARGMASLAMTADATTNRVIQPIQLRRIGRQAERKVSTLALSPATIQSLQEEEPPFGWLPE